MNDDEIQVLSPSCVPREKKVSGYLQCTQHCIKYCGCPPPPTTPQVHSLISVLKKFLIRVERKAQYWKKKNETDRRQNLLAIDQKSEWLHFKMYGINYGDVTELLIWCSLEGSMTYFDMWAVVKCWFINSKLCAIIYNNKENSKRIFCLNKTDHFYMWQPSHAGEEVLSLVMLVAEW